MHDVLCATAFKQPVGFPAFMHCSGAVAKPKTQLCRGARAGPARCRPETRLPCITCIRAIRFDNPGMNRNIASTIGLPFTGCLLVAGCAAPSTAPQHYSIRHLERHDSQAVFDAAAATLSDLGYSISERDPAGGVLSGLRSEEPSGKGEGARRATLSAQRPRRTVAQVRIETADETVKVRCRVLIQEQVTDAHRIIAHDINGQDMPGQTPIDRDAGTTPEQNAVWRTIGRDKLAERKILSRILELDEEL